MKATELMIGDWVEFHQEDGQGFYAQVEGLEAEGTFSESGYYADNRVSPIPLTEEVLFRNFQAGDDEVAWWENTEFENDAKDEYLWWHIVITGQTLVIQGEIRYVHELQHALRLCGVDVDIEL